MTTYGYCKMRSQNTPENRVVFANLYFYGALAAYWLGYYLFYVIYCIKAGNYDSNFDPTLWIFLGLISPVIATLFAYYFYSCLMSYAEEGERVGDYQAITGAQVVYAQVPVAAVAQPNLYQQQQATYMQPN